MHKTMNLLRVAHFTFYIFWLATLALAAYASDSITLALQKFHINRTVSGATGVVLFTASYLYALKKYNLVQKFNLQKLLKLHALFNLTGSLIIMIHAGRYFHAPLPWVAAILLFIIITLGFITRYFYSLSISLKEKIFNNKKVDKNNIIQTEEKLNTKTNSDDIKNLSRFRAVHLGFTRIFWGVLIAHIIMSYAYSK